ncbi:M67 family metallopeptidase [Chloroflexus sp.]|uniref:M67 family metallopeptidase n=1 Tax=Chloroflexus sp. TaxID=1904827 RepID=UPI0026337631|nr:M67 family metallopeptidase [uncultured Chloroflexus sp.]
MTLILPAKAAAAIAAHAESTYPDECVGLLIGTLNDEYKTALQVVPLENRWSGQVQLAPTDDPLSRRDRFYLDPRDYLRAEREARAGGYEIIGCYHSHPDAIAVPSERDRIGAQAIGGSRFSFVIQAVRSGVAAELTSWLLVNEGVRFIEEQVQIVPAERVAR